ncbi:hypothetical protein E4U22_003896 [Claviceps purpurea]|nr:hypothetical protein E4U22_003896 [Claviceps purpurea]
MAISSLPSATGPAIIVNDGCKDIKRVATNFQQIYILLDSFYVFTSVVYDNLGTSGAGQTRSSHIYDCFDFCIENEQTLDLARLFGTAILKDVQKKKEFLYMRERRVRHGVNL